MKLGHGFAAPIILSFIFGLFLIVASTTLVLDFKTGGLQKKLDGPKSLLAELFKEATPSPVQNVNVTFDHSTQATATPSASSKVNVKVNNSVSVSSCTRYNIREGEFASNKCYSSSDYDDLVYYLGRFNTAVFNLDSANSSMRITCSGSDFFKDSCERDKKQAEDAQNQINNYRTTINSIIAKGR